jgi:hypothetical protein
MSVVTKRVAGKEYVYFQTYQDGRRVDLYIGPAVDPRTWIDARERLRDYRQGEMVSELATVDKKIAERLKLTRRRLQLYPEKIQSREELAKRLETAVNEKPVVAYHPMLKDELEKLLSDIKEKRKTQS